MLYTRVLTAIYSEFTQGQDPAPMRQYRRIRQSYHRPSRCRAIAGLSGFLTLIQSRHGPDR
jgi:hypothetical protein